MALGIEMSTPPKLQWEYGTLYLLLPLGTPPIVEEHGVPCRELCLTCGHLAKIGCSHKPGNPHYCEHKAIAVPVAPPRHSQTV